MSLKEELNKISMENLNKYCYKVDTYYDVVDQGTYFNLRCFVPDNDIIKIQTTNEAAKNGKKKLLWQRFLEA
jgi:hypothetical protein